MYISFVFLGAALAIILAIGQLMSQNRTDRNYLAAALLLCIGSVQMVTYFQNEGYFHQHPGLTGTQYPLITLIGPLFYCYFMRLLDPSFRVTKKQSVHVIPFVATPIIMSRYLALSGEERQSIQLDYLAGQTALWETFPNNLSIIILLGLFAYVLAPLIKIGMVFKFNELIKERSIAIALVAIVCFIANIVCVIFVQFYDSSVLKKMSGSLLSLWIIAIYLVDQRFPSFLSTVTDTLSQAKYKRSQLVNVNVKPIITQLKQLFDQDKVFLQEDLTLSSLAQCLSITPHQLSEILNHNLDTSFKDYLKKHRIEEAQKRLVEYPTQSILSLSMEVGFKSASTFNTAFKTKVGLSPAEYRKRALAEG